MATYAVKRYWEVCDTVMVKASSVKDAIRRAHLLPLGKHPEFVPDSMDSDPNADVQRIPKSMVMFHG